MAAGFILLLDLRSQSVPLVKQELLLMSRPEQTRRPCHVGSGGVETPRQQIFMGRGGDWMTG